VVECTLGDSLRRGGDERVDRVDRCVPRCELGSTPKARAKPGPLRLGGGREELAARTRRRTRRTDRPAVDAGRAHADEEHAVEPRVLRGQRLVTGVIGEHAIEVPRTPPAGWPFPDIATTSRLPVRSRSN